MSFDTRNYYLVAQAGQAPQKTEEPLKVDNTDPRNVVVVEDKSRSPLETALQKADEAGGAILTLMILAVAGFVFLGGHKKIFEVFDAVAQLINLLRETQRDTTEAVKRNSLTLEKVSENDVKITDTLQRQQQTIEGLLMDTPLIKGKQEDQIARLKYAIKLLEFNADLIIRIADSLKLATNDRPDKLEEKD